MRFNHWLFALTLLVAPAAASARAQTAAPAGDPYVRYNRPSQCAEAAQRLFAFYWRDKRHDTARYAPLTDTLPMSVVQQVRACGARFSVASVPEGDLLGLIRVALYAKQPSLYQSALARYKAIERTKEPDPRAWMQLHLVNALLGVLPMPVAEVDQQLADLDSIGPMAIPLRIQGHVAVSGFALGIGDTARALREGEVAVALSARMSHFDRIDNAGVILLAYQTLARARSIRGRAPVLSTMDTAETDVLPLRERGSYGAALANNPDPDGGDMGSWSADQGRFKQLIAETRAPYAVVGNTVTPFVSSHWYNASDSAARPAPHAVSLVVSIDPDFCVGLDCFSKYTVLRRLYDAYHAKGLQIVLLGATHGSFKMKLEDKPAEEAERIRGYVLDFLKLPGVLSIEETVLQRIADGRRFGQPSSNRGQLFRGQVDAAIIDKDGKISMVGELRPSSFERLFSDRIGALLGAP